MRAAALIAAGACFGLLAGVNLARPYYGPRLAGYGCIGAAGLLYADEESDFPRCARIVPYGEE